MTVVTNALTLTLICAIFFSDSCSYCTVRSLRICQKGVQGNRTENRERENRRERERERESESESESESDRENSERKKYEEEIERRRGQEEKERPIENRRKRHVISALTNPPRSLV